MIDTTAQWTEEDIALTNANLELLSEFVQEFIELPDDAKLFPEHAKVVFLPSHGREDQGLVEANLRMARKMEADGKTVWIWTIGSGKATTLQEYEALLATETIQR